MGVGVASFIDETVFHQLLHWHHFYDKSTPDVGLVSDGVFHAGGWLAMVVGLSCSPTSSGAKSLCPNDCGQAR